MLAIAFLAIVQAQNPNLPDPIWGREKPPAQSDWKCPKTDTGYRCEMVGKATDAGGAALILRTEGERLKAPQSITATMPTPLLRGRLMRLSADVRTTDAATGATLTLRVERFSSPAHPMPYSSEDASGSVVGTSGWRHLETSLMVPVLSNLIEFGLQLSGSGRVETRNLRIEPVTATRQAGALATPLASLAALRSRVPEDSSSADDVIAALGTVERAFAHLWFSATTLQPSIALQSSWRKEIPLDTVENPARPQYVRGTGFSFGHCHPPVVIGKGAPIIIGNQANPFAISQRQFQINSGPELHAICPSWLLTESNSMMGDERLNPDTTIAPQARRTVSNERVQVIRALTRASERFKDNNWIIGQRVRFLVDQRDTVEARLAVNQCAADEWWCMMLDGYVTHWAGKPSLADTLFAIALKSAPEAVRCELNDLRVILPAGADSAYRAIPCAQRDAINRKIWWLSDPLYTEPGNERRAEHYARAVQIRLRSATVFDNPFDWGESAGGAGVRDMFARYGAPAARLWLGETQDMDHQGYLSALRPFHFTTAEYFLDRYHPVPAWHAVEHPFEAALTDWQMTVDAFSRSRADAKFWWPQEHYARDSGPLVQLFEHQVAMFQRDEGVLLALAVDPAATDSTRTGQAPAKGTMVLSTAPDSFAFRPMAMGEGTTMQTHTIVPPARSQLLGAELALGARAMGRLRFGVTTPAAVQSATTIALSDVALLAANSAGEWPRDPEPVLARMHGTTTFDDLRKFGVYFETYGVRPTDSLTLSIRIENLDAPGTFRRIGQALRLAERTERSVTISWSVGRASENAAVIPGRVSTIGRVAAVDGSFLTPGHYRLTVIVNRAGTPAASASRELTIRG